MPNLLQAASATLSRESADSSGAALDPAVHPSVDGDDVLRPPCDGVNGKYMLLLLVLLWCCCFPDAATRSWRARALD